MAEVGFSEVSIKEDDIAEIGIVEEVSTEVGIAEVGFSEVRSNIRMLLPPLVPYLYALFEDSEMLLFCHRVFPSLLSGFAHLISVFDPNSSHWGCIR